LLSDFSTTDRKILFDLHDALRGEDGLCERMATVETSLNNHLESQKQKFNKTTILLTIFIGVIGVVAALK